MLLNTPVVAARAVTPVAMHEMQVLFRSEDVRREVRPAYRSHGGRRPGGGAGLLPLGRWVGFGAARGRRETDLSLSVPVFRRVVIAVRRLAAGGRSP